MAKPLRDITPKGDKKLLSDKLKGVNKSETKPLDLDDFLMDPNNMKGSKDFIKKHEVQQHDDRVGNKEAPYKSSKGQAKYERADGKMYEAADCTCDDDKDACAVHGKKGKKLLLGGKKGSMREHAELSGLEAQVGAVPEGMAKNAENTWKNAEQYFDKPPTQLTGQGKPFLSKMGDSLKEAIREIQKEAVTNMHEVAPPSKSSEEWIKKNKARFKKEYGAEKGERVLYGKAWNDYKEKH